MSLALFEPMACLDCQMFLNFYILDLGLDFQSATDIDDPTLSVVGLADKEIVFVSPFLPIN